MAVIQADTVLEDHGRLDSGPLSSLDSGPQGTFVGIYDGHGGPQVHQNVTILIKFIDKSKFLLDISTLHG